MPTGGFGRVRSEARFFRRFMSPIVLVSDSGGDAVRRFVGPRGSARRAVPRMSRGSARRAVPRMSRGSARRAVPRMSRGSARRAAALRSGIDDVERFEQVVEAFVDLLAADLERRREKLGLDG